MGSDHPKTSAMRTCITLPRLLGLALAVLTSAASISAMGSEALPLFNGQDLKGWTGNLSLWSVKDGTITGQTTAADPIKNNTFLVWTNGVVGDFELRFSYKITSNNKEGFANSGCQYRSRLDDPGKFIVGGYQADFEAGTTYSGILYEERGRGILAQRGQATLVKPDPKDPFSCLAFKTVTESTGDLVYLRIYSGTLKSQVPWASQNGDASHSIRQRIWNRLSTRRPPISGQVDS